jgi:transposase
LGVTLSGANAHDKTQFRAVIEAHVVARPSPKRRPQHLALDKGYDYEDIRRSVSRRGYRGHIPRRGQTCRRKKRHRARRWVVERTGSWHNRFRRLTIRYEVHARNYLGFVQLASAIICFRRARAA